jgi:abhydrolase domain-containing protein 12
MVYNRNVIAIDYRGYGDSTGSPSEDGLLSDATTVWEYISTHSSRKTSRSEQPVQEEGKSIVVMGHSLGTAVSSRLAGYLADRGTLSAPSPPGIVYPKLTWRISLNRSQP